MDSGSCVMANICLPLLFLRQWHCIQDPFPLSPFSLASEDLGGGRGQSYLNDSAALLPSGFSLEDVIPVVCRLELVANMRAQPEAGWL